jgi:hypothetical protein
MRPRIALLFLAPCVLATACSTRTLSESMMGSSFRPNVAGVAGAALTTHASRFQLLAGDLHCHVSPPDGDSDVTRGFDETAELAKEEGLDFVALTPHVASRFFSSEGARAKVRAGQHTLRDEIAAYDAAPDAKNAKKILFTPGFEYTDYKYGHVGVAFADLDAVLDALPTAEAKDHPERFFERWVESGGTLVANHPLVTPIPTSIFAIARADLSFRPWTSKQPSPPEMLAVARLAQGFEAYNVPASHLRDRLLLGDSEKTLHDTLLRLDREIVAQGRRMTPVGGSDSHGHNLRATTFVLAEARTVKGVRDAVVAGRVCIRAADACTLEARLPEGEWITVGDALPKTSAIEVRAHGDGIDVIVNGAVVATPRSDEVVKVTVQSGVCSVLRARVGEGYSAPIYIGCL